MIDRSKHNLSGSPHLDNKSVLITEKSEGYEKHFCRLRVEKLLYEFVWKTRHKKRDLQDDVVNLSKLQFSL